MSVKEDLARMGVAKNDIVLLHSSLRRINPYPGRAEGLIDDLRDYLSDGIIAMPALTWELALLDRPRRVFDVTATPADTGTLPELFRRTPGVLRSAHPTHSLCAAGNGAEGFLAGQEYTHTPCALSGPWGRLCDSDAVIVMAGCDLTSCTYLHGVEEWTHEGLHLDEPLEFTLRLYDGSETDLVSRPHRGNPSEQFGRAQQALLDSGALAFGSFGNSRALYLRAKKTRDTVERLLWHDPHLFDDPV